ncbi:hypothetical protein ACFQ6N_00555 [Kitasatospora sp. NPDC056446]|uniref:hypothetical protein n=1 Tax=Kitasatospora sp. NPDC056446 TaxID=3345819 RepID=UPI0036B8CD43
MTSIADALGIMVSDRAPSDEAEQTRVLQSLRGRPRELETRSFDTRPLETRPLETRSSTVARHGRFLEELLAGEADVQDERHREG